jgi:hypothetical protein
MTTRITATEAARRFSDIVNRVVYRRETFVVERAGEAVCEIGPARPTTAYGKDLVGLLDSIPRPDDEYLDLVEKLLKNQPKIAKSPWRR